MMTVDKVLSDSSVSYWLKNALRTALNNDPVDAVNDAELLLAVLKKNLEVVFNEVG